MGSSGPSDKAAALPARERKISFLGGKLLLGVETMAKINSNSYVINCSFKGVL